MFLGKEVKVVYTEYYGLEVTDRYVKHINDNLDNYMANSKDFNITAEDILAIYDYNDSKIRKEICRKEINIHGQQFDVVEKIRDWLNQGVCNNFIDSEFDKTLDTYEYVDL